MASHHLKALISSTHFKNIAMDGRFTQDNRQITFIGQVSYCLENLSVFQGNIEMLGNGLDTN